LDVENPDTLHALNFGNERLRKQIKTWQFASETPMDACV